MGKSALVAIVAVLSIAVACKKEEKQEGKKEVAQASPSGAVGAAATAGSGAGAQAAAAADADADAQVKALEKMCAESAEAIEKRQAARSLFDRVGGAEKLNAVVKETVRLHHENAAIKHLMEGVDTERLVALVTEFLVVGTGGKGTYSGRDMKTAHAHLDLGNPEFLAAGADLAAAMKKVGIGEEEAQEITCAFVSLRGDVVTK